MKKIEVLGPGCPKCNKLAENIKQAADQIGVQYTLEKVTDIATITEYGIMMTPALVVDGKVKFFGKVPSVDELKKYLN
jgi:small redox-active disulfide protein 2